MVNVTDHVHVHKTVVPGPHGEQVVAMTVDEDINIQGILKKNEVQTLEKGLGVGVVAEPRGLNGESVGAQPSGSTTY